MPLYWFKGPVGEPFQFQCGPDGIHVPRLADEVKLKPSPLKLNGVVVDFDKGSGYLSIQDAQEFIQDLGGSTETAIPVDGQPAGEWPASIMMVLCGHLYAVTNDSIMP
jgi:hypothetical protein